MIADKADLTSLLKRRGLRPIDLARLMEVDKSTVSRWSENGVPFERVLDVERVTGIPRHDLRPDYAKVFGQSQ